MKLNKMSLKEISELSNMDTEWIWWEESKDLSQTEFKFVTDLIISKEPELKRSDIFIHWHAVVGEYCIYIKNKWSGYVEDWHLAGYTSYEDYYQYHNINKNNTSFTEGATKPIDNADNIFK